VFLSFLPTGSVLMLQVAQAGSQGDKKARRVLSLRAHHLKETLLMAKTDLKAHKATARQQAYKIGLLSCILQIVLLSMPLHGLYCTVLSQQIQSSNMSLDKLFLLLCDAEPMHAHKCKSR